VSAFVLNGLKDAQKVVGRRTEMFPILHAAMGCNNFKNQDYISSSERELMLE
jgi:hypothetical protein